MSKKDGVMLNEGPIMKGGLNTEPAGPRPEMYIPGQGPHTEEERIALEKAEEEGRKMARKGLAKAFGTEHPIHPDRMKKIHKSLLMYLETRLVDYSGLVDLRRMNKDDCDIAKSWTEQGFIVFRKFADIEASHSNSTHMVQFSDAAWKFAHQFRRDRAERNSVKKEMANDNPEFKVEIRKPFPRRQEGGWTIDPEFLAAVKLQIGNFHHVSWEDIEVVLLALEKIAEITPDSVVHLVFDLAERVKLLEHEFRKLKNSLNICL